jgi:RNA polymerase sigma-70 factor (ECF subfamily)
MPTATVDDEVIAALRSGDQAAFAAVIERFRRQLHVHCYRMLGSFDEAEEIVQETFLRAWRARRAFEGRALLRSWLYRIATNACLDVIARRRPQRVVVGDEVTWLQPYPDRLLEPVAPSRDEPEEMAVSRETIELAFIVAIHYLPPRQRAVLIARDVVGLPARGTAVMLDMSVASVNSALQRARATLDTRNPAVVPRALSDEQQALVARYVAAFEAYDVVALTKLLHDEATLSMPPYEMWLQGHASIAEWLLSFGLGCRGSVLVPVEACGGTPAFAQYRRMGEWPWALILLDVAGDRIRGMTSYLDVEMLFPRFGLPMRLEA